MPLVGGALTRAIAVCRMPMYDSAYCPKQKMKQLPIQASIDAVQLYMPLRVTRAAAKTVQGCHRADTLGLSEGLSACSVCGLLLHG